MRRHYLYPDQEHERGVGDGDANLLQLWLQRRTELLNHEQLARFFVLFWDLAKARHDDMLSASRYCDFFARVAKALLQSVNADNATAIAPRDWLYDTEGAGCDADAENDADATPATIGYEHFREAVMQLAELVLPVESDASMFVSFFRELRECVATAIDAITSDGDSNSNRVSTPALTASQSSPALVDATAQYTLRALADVPKIRGAFLQKVPPSAEQLKAISGLAPPDATTMSLKQLLLSYNPRKFALSRQFSALFSDNAQRAAVHQHEPSQPLASLDEALGSSSTTEDNGDGDNGDSDGAAASADSNATLCRIALTTASAPTTSRILNMESDDAWDPEVAALERLTQFPALRVAVVGPPHVGKTRVAKLLADRLRLRYVSLATVLEDAVKRKQMQQTAARAAAAVVQAAEAEAAAVAASEAAAASAASETTNEDELPAGGSSEAAAATSDPDAAASESPGESNEAVTAASDPDAAAAGDPDAAVSDDTSLQPPLSSLSESGPPTTAMSAVAYGADDALFSDVDLANLFAGAALPRPQCLALLVAFVKQSLLEGVGVVLDDVHPSEIETEISVDYVVVLSAAQRDVQTHAQQLALAPTSRRVYSARERAALAADAQALGYADVVLEPPSVPAPSTTCDTMDARTRAASVDASGDDDGSVDTAATESAAALDESSKSVAEAAAPVEPTPAERNWIEPPDEPLVPLQSLVMKSFRNRYREYARRVESRLADLARSSASDATSRYHVVHVLAAQSLCVVLDQCVRAMSGNTLGISRSSASRRAVPVELPEDVAAAGSSRADHVRWLLHSDWSALEPAANADAAADDDAAADAADVAADSDSARDAAMCDDWSLLPTHSSRRRLSRWREFCPVASHAAQRLVLGDPRHAVTFGGRVYLTATREARDAFCAHPLQYLRAAPPVTRLRRIWLASSSGMELTLAEQLPMLASSLDVRAFDALEVLASRCPMTIQMELMQGKSLTSAQAAEIVADAALVGRNANNSDGVGAAWLLTNLSLTSEAVATLEARGCLPELVAVLEPSAEQLAADANDTLAQLRHTYFQTAVAAAIERLQSLGVTVVTTTLHDDADDTAAALLRHIDPLVPRVDCEADGHLGAGDLTAAFASTAEDESAADSGTSESGDEPRAETLREGETNRFCAVTWKLNDVLAPGRREFVASFNGAFYCFAGKNELDAFARNPLKYVPHSCNATATAIPILLLLGVRGADIARLSASIARAGGSGSGNTSSGSASAVVVADLDAVARKLEQRLRIESLRSEDAQQSPLELYAQELAQELQRCEALVRVAGSSDTDGCRGCVLLPGLGADASRLPSPEQLVRCFDRDVFPLFVVPLTVDADRAVALQLELWRAQQPERRKKLRAQRAAVDDSGEADKSDDDATADAEVAEAEAEEAQRLQEQHATDVEALDAALDALRTRGIAVAPSPLDASGSLRQCARQLTQHIDALLMRTPALFDRVDVVQSHAALVRALATGELLVGHHGTTCPVTGATSDALAHAVVCRERVYFPSSRDALAAFTANPARFVWMSPPQQQSLSPRQRCCHAPTAPPTCCVAGAPGAGKTQFAKALAAHYGLVYVSPHAAVEWVVQCCGSTALYETLRAAQRAGAEPATQAVADAVVARLQSAECQTRGWVLDDALQEPANLQQFKRGSASGLTDPMLLVLLDGDLRTLWQRKQQTQCSTEVIGHTNGDDDAREQFVRDFARWQRQQLDALGFWSLTFGSNHVQQLDTTQHSFWHALACTRKRLDALITHARAYRQAIAMDRAAPLHGVVRRSTALRAQMHDVFGSYCPVALANSQYVCTWATSDRTRCVQFGAHVFWLATARAVAQFIAQPLAFVSRECIDATRTAVTAAPLDASLLSLVSVADCAFPELRGYCPVTFARGRGATDWRAIVRGCVWFRAAFGGRVFVFASERARRRFLLTPTAFASVKLPVKLPPELSATLSKHAKSATGQLEQALAAVLTECLLALASARPKFPHASVRATAVVSLALALKRRVLSLSPAAASAVAAKQRAFERDCRLSERLKAALTPQRASCGPAVKSVRAGLAHSNSSSSDSIGGRTGAALYDDGDQDDDAQALCRRFDEIMGCSDASPRIDAAVVRASFVAYTTL